MLRGRLCTLKKVPYPLITLIASARVHSCRETAVRYSPRIKFQQWPFVFYCVIPSSILAITTRNCYSTTMHCVSWRGYCLSLPSIHSIKYVCEKALILRENVIHLTVVYCTYVCRLNCLFAPEGVGMIDSALITYGNSIYDSIKNFS